MVSHLLANGTRPPTLAHVSVLPHREHAANNLGVANIAGALPHPSCFACREHLPPPAQAPRNRRIRASGACTPLLMVGSRQKSPAKSPALPDPRTGRALSASESAAAHFSHRPDRVARRGPTFTRQEGSAPGFHDRRPWGERASCGRVLAHQGPTNRHDGRNEGSGTSGLHGFRITGKLSRVRARGGSSRGAGGHDTQAFGTSGRSVRSARIDRSRKTATFPATTRRRNRTFQAGGCPALPVLKTG